MNRHGIKSLDEPIDANIYGNKAAWLSILKSNGVSVPDTLALPACTADECDKYISILANSKDFNELISIFKSPNGTYDVAVRSSSTIEDLTTASCAGHFLSILGKFSILELLNSIKSVYHDGLEKMPPGNGEIAVIIQCLIEPALAGVCFSANPINSSRNELLISFTQGFAGDLVAGKSLGQEFSVNKNRSENESHVFHPEFTQKSLSRLCCDVIRLEISLGQPLDIEWCIDSNDNVYYVQCRPITTFRPARRGLVPVTITNYSIIPQAVANHDKIAIRLFCEKIGIYISNALLHIAYDTVREDDLDLASISPSSCCVSFSAVLVHPRKLDGKIVRNFAENTATQEVCEARKCVRYSMRDLANQADLKIKLRAMHTAALSNHWLSIIIIQEIFEPKFTGILKRVDRGVLVELAFGHFVPKGVVPTSQYLLDNSGHILMQKEAFQEYAYMIKNGEAVKDHVNALVTVPETHLIAILSAFFQLLVGREQAIEFGILEDNLGVLRPYLIDLVDVNPETDVPDSLMEGGVISDGIISGRIVRLGPEALSDDSLDSHFYNNIKMSGPLSKPTIYHAKRPDIGLLKYISASSPNSVGFVFEEGSFLCHLAIILRERRIPAIICSESLSIDTDGIMKLDASTSHLVAARRITQMPKKLVFSYENPDADGIISSLAYSYFKECIGELYDAVFFGIIDNESSYILSICNIVSPRKVTKIDSRKLYCLVDTHHLSQLPKGIDPTNALEILDHHTGGDPDAFLHATIRNEKVGAVCTLLVEDMQNNGIFPLPGLAKAMALAILSNTLNFEAPSTTLRDRSARKWLDEFMDLSDAEIKEMFRARADFSGRDLYDILSENCKTFSIRGRVIIIVQIEACGINELFDEMQIRSYMAQLMNSNNGHFCAVNLVDPFLKHSTVLVADEASCNLLICALAIDFNQMRADVDRILLRKTDFIPQIENFITNQECDDGISPDTSKH